METFIVQYLFSYTYLVLVLLSNSPNSAIKDMPHNVVKFNMIVKEVRTFVILSNLRHLSSSTVTSIPAVILFRHPKFV